MNLGEKIILLRKQKGITQEKLAEVINVTRTDNFKMGTEPVNA